MALNIVKDIDSRVAVKNVLMSVSDKTGLESFVPALVKACPDVKIYSTGGTYAKVKEILGADADRYLVAVSDYTGQPEMQGGLVKTLAFKIYLGLLSATSNTAHQADLFDDTPPAEKSRLYAAVDALNARYGKGKVFSAAQGLGARSWHMKRQKLSRRPTTRWDELMTAK